VLNSGIKGTTCTFFCWVGDEHSIGQQHQQGSRGAGSRGAGAFVPPSQLQGQKKQEGQAGAGQQQGERKRRFQERNREIAAVRSNRQGHGGGDDDDDAEEGGRWSGPD
jgi:hypothetical protein